MLIRDPLQYRLDHNVGIAPLLRNGEGMVAGTFRKDFINPEMALLAINNYDALVDALDIAINFITDYSQNIGIRHQLNHVLHVAKGELKSKDLVANPPARLSAPDIYDD